MVSWTCRAAGAGAVTGEGAAAGAAGAIGTGGCAAGGTGAATADAVACTVAGTTGGDRSPRRATATTPPTTRVTPAAISDLGPIRINVFASRALGASTWVPRAGGDSVMVTGVTVPEA